MRRASPWGAGWRSLAASLGLLAALGPGCLCAAEVALLKSSEVPAWRPVIEALRRTTSAHTVTEYDLRGDRVEAERIVASLKGKAAIVVAMGALAAQVATSVLPEAPLVYCFVQDPVRLGVLPTSAGVSFQTPIKNQLAAFRLVNPRGVRIGVIYKDPAVAKLVEEAQKASPVVRLTIVARPVASEKEVPSTLRALLQGEDAVDALWIPPDPMFLGEETRRFLLAETQKAARPVYAFSHTLLSEGALVSSGPDFVSVGEQAGDLVNRFASGDRTTRGTLLVPRAELVINKKVADRMKIEISAQVLKEARVL